MERLLLVVCPSLTLAAGGRSSSSDDEDGGRRLRQFARIVDVLTEVCPWVDPVRPGVCTLPIRGPSRYLGGEAAVLERVTDLVVAVVGGGGAVVGGGGAVVGGDGAVQLGVADGVFAASLAARSGTVVAEGGTPAFLSPWPVATLGTPVLSELLPRLGLHTLGQFGSVPERDVLARFGTAGVRCHRLAQGAEGECPGYRVVGLGARLAVLQHGIGLRNHQSGFWGETSTADTRAAEVLTTLQRRFGPDAVVTAVAGDGRGPGERVRFLPWRADRLGTGGRGRPGDGGGGGPRPPPAPWPGRLPPPEPARVAVRGQEAAIEIVGGSGSAVGVTARGELTSDPVQVSFAGGPWVGITGWSTPWPAEERWWSRARRRAARMQITTADGRAHLVTAERGRWWLAATYD
ncbi:MAG: hypothetical protein ACYDHU_11370 [Acidimicrobiales bacterium]